MRILIVVILLSMLCGAADGQVDSVGAGEPASNHSLIGQAGTLGPGLFYNRVLDSSRRLMWRVGGQYIAYRKPIQLETAPNSYLTIAPDFMISTVQAGLRWNPFRRGSFFLVAGVGYTWPPALNVVISANDKLNLGGLELTPEDVGTVRLGVRWHPVVGYAGWGFGRAIPRRRVSVGFEMGVYYLGKPSIQLDYEGFLETTNLNEQVPVVERNLSNYRYLPSLSLTVAYALHRFR
jgi:hypothetical protein